MIRLLRTALICAGLAGTTLVVLMIGLPPPGVHGPPPGDDRSTPSARATVPPARAFDSGPISGPAYDPELRRSPTRSKSQSKLWFHDGTWWAVMLDSDDREFRIFAFDPSRLRWVDTGTLVDARHHVGMDVLWDGSSLVVVSVGGNTASRRHAAQVSRFSYDPQVGRYLMDADFPVSVTEAGVGPATIARDGTGALWVTYVADERVMYLNTTGEDHRWSAPTPLPLEHTAVGPDEAAVVAFGGDSIGVMWSNQRTEGVYFAVHADGDPPDRWSPTETVIEEQGIADDHITLRSLMTPDGPVVLAATKTSKDEVPTAGRDAPQILVVKRGPDGTWVHSLVGRVVDRHSRPVLAIEEDVGLIHVFATSTFEGGGTFHKVAYLDDLVFDIGVGETFLWMADRSLISNVSVTKQSVSAESGLVVMASDDHAGQYVTRAIGLGGSTFPIPRLPISTSGESLVLSESFDPWMAGDPVGHGWSVSAGTAEVVRFGQGTAIRLVGEPDSGARMCKPFGGHGGLSVSATALVRIDSFGTARSALLKLRSGGAEVMAIRVNRVGAIDYTAGEARLRGPVVPLATLIEVSATASPTTKTYDLELVVEPTRAALLAATDVPLAAFDGTIDEVCFEAAPNSDPGGLVIDAVRVSRLE